MPTSSSISSESLEFLREHISPSLHVWHASHDLPLENVLTSAALSLAPTTREQLTSSIGESLNMEGVHAFEVNDQYCLSSAALPNLEGKYLYLLAAVECRPEAAQLLVRNAIECWSLRAKNKLADAALSESAMQLAQSFEEQNWLREFARNATTFSKVTSANDVARVILQPLGYLSRAEDVFLIVDPEETERSGLISASYGSSEFTIQTIAQVLNSYQFGKRSAPLVRNNIELKTPEGVIRSIVSVVVSDSQADRGYLVTVNRITEDADVGIPVYDPEFGSGDVSLLEDAAALLSTQAENMHLLLQSNDLFLGTLRAMSSTIDARDPYTQGHSERVARLSYDLARILGLPDQACHEIYLSGILHDIGKIGIPDSVLLKPGKLTDEEFDIIKQHPVIGHRIVERLDHLQFTLPGVLHHHERWDGQGYPHGLKGTATPLMARIMAVADAFDAMTSCRPYRTAMPLEKACSIIYSGAGGQWDAEIVECFKKWVATQDIPSKANAQTNSIIPLEAPHEQLSQAVMSLLT